MGADEKELKLFGSVKGVDPVKRFGPIVPDVSKEDILLHANVLTKYM